MRRATRVSLLTHSPCGLHCKKNVQGTDLESAPTCVAVTDQLPHSSGAAVTDQLQASLSSPQVVGNTHSWAHTFGDPSEMGICTTPGGVEGRSWSNAMIPLRSGSDTVRFPTPFATSSCSIPAMIENEQSNLYCWLPNKAKVPGSVVSYTGVNCWLPTKAKVPGSVVPYIDP